MIEDELRAFHRSQFEADTQGLDRYSGRDWWQITEAEREVFSIDLADMPALVAAWGMFDAITGIAGNDFIRTELCTRAAASLSYITQGRTEEREWSQFCAMLRIPAPKAMAWFWRYFFWHERAGTNLWKDEGFAMPRRAVDVQ